MATLNVGTPLWKRPTQESGGINIYTMPVPPAQTGENHTEFVGVTTRINEDDGRLIPVQRDGELYCRVMGPVNKGDPVGRSNGHDYAIANAEPVIGIAQETISGSEIKILKVQTYGVGSSAGNTLVPRWG